MIKKETSKASILFAASPSLPHAVSACIMHFKKLKNIEVHENISFDNCTSLTDAGRFPVVVFSIDKLEDCVAVAKFLIHNQKKIKDSCMRVFALSRIENSKMAELLKSKGCSEVIPPSIGAKALQFKIQQSVNVINAALVKMQQSQEADREVSSLAQSNDGSNIGGDNAVKINWVDAIDNPNDIWIHEEQLRLKKVKDFWLIDLLGPGQELGSWMDYKHPISEGSPLWKWSPREGLGMSLLPENGVWVFRGRQPEFDIKISRWHFISQKPLLALLSNDQINFSRLSISMNNELRISKNSKHALDKKATILDNIKKEFLIKTEKQKLSKELTAERGEDPERAAWNNAIAEDDAAKNWNDHDSGSEQRQGGRGLGQGQAGTESHIDYEQEEYATGDAAFDAYQMKITCKGAIIQFLDLQGEIATFEGSAILAEPGSSFTFKLENNFISGGHSLILRGTVQQIETTNECATLQVKLDEPSRLLMNQVFEKFESRQSNVDRFLKQAKGAA